MSLEVELKAPCEGVEEKVRTLGARFMKSEAQEDTYFSHPARDFRRTDEALRVRNVKGRLTLTYKGPKTSADMKTREEIEFKVPKDAYALLEQLGFRKAFTIKKRRRTYRLGGLTICCDRVVGLGEYVEVESKNPRDADRIRDILSRLGVKGKATTKTYAELLGM